MRKQKTSPKGKGTQKVRAYLSLLRPVNFFMVLFAGLVAGVIVRAPLFCTILASLSAALISGGAQAINDYFDVEIDLKKKKYKPIVRGDVKREHARLFAVSLYIVGIVLAVFLSPLHALIALFATITTYAYSAFFSDYKYVGNILVSFFVGAVFLYVGLCGDFIRSLFPFLLAFLANWAREVIKDLEDLEIDRGKKITLPMIAGTEMSRYFAAYLLLLSVFFSIFPGPFGFGLFSVYYYYLLLPTDLLFILSALYVIRGNERRAERICKVAMLLGILSFAAGTVL